MNRSTMMCTPHYPPPPTLSPSLHFYVSGPPFLKEVHFSVKLRSLATGSCPFHSLMWSVIASLYHCFASFHWILPLNLQIFNLERNTYVHHTKKKEEKEGRKGGRERRKEVHEKNEGEMIEKVFSWSCYSFRSNYGFRSLLTTLPKFTGTYLNHLLTP